MTATDIAAHPIHLGRGATAEIEPRFTGSTDWYAAYSERHATDGADGRLVSMFSFDRSWDSWEMHPRGSEVVLCVSGSMTLHQEHADGTVATVTLRPGQYAINPPGTWHTADIADGATAVFITAGLGTEIRSR
jgi:mannose-6-phosphate isomerase-like protein (cupin superfamily)